MSLFHSLISDPQEYELFLIIGDSNADGRGEYIPTVPVETLYLWNGSGIDEITTQTVANDGSFGSSWQQFAIDYKSAFGKRVVIVQHGVGGSEFLPNGDNNNWYTTGTLYTPAKDAALDAQTFLGVDHVNVIINLGINDIRGAQLTADILTAITSLRDRLNTDLSTPEIYYVLPGRTESIINSDRMQQVKRLIVNVALDANAHIVSCMSPFFPWGLYAVDNLHLTQAGYDLIGAQIVRYMRASAYARHSRTIISSMRYEVNETKKAAIDAFVGFFSAFTGTVDSFHMYVADQKDNIYLDWGLMAVGDQGGGTVNFTANDCIETSGSGTYFRTYFLQTSMRSTNTDFAEFVKTGTVTSSGTAFLFGKSDASRSMRTYQASGTLHAQATDITDNTYAGESVFDSDAIYAVARNGTNKMLKKDAANVISVTQASTGALVSQDTFVGTSNQNGTASTSWMQAEYKCWGVLQLSDIVWGDFVTALNTLITAMETP